MYALNTSMNRTRSDYYQGNYTPHMFTNGLDSGSSLNAWVEDPKKYMNEVSSIEFSFEGINNNDKYNFSITAKSLINTENSTDLRLFIAPVLGKVVYPGSYNGLYEHHNVIIEQLTGNTGKSINFLADVDYVETFSWSIPTQWVDNTQLKWNSNTIKIITWIQNYNTKEILQAAEFAFK